LLILIIYMATLRMRTIYRERGGNAACIHLAASDAQLQMQSHSLFS